MNRILAAAVMTAALIAGSPARGDVIVQNSAQNGWASDLPTREVHFADLNLDTPLGVERLNTRIAAAVRYVCGQADTRMLPEYMAMRGCRDNTLQRAFADRDAVLAARLAARGQPEKLAALDRSFAIGVSPRR